MHCDPERWALALIYGSCGLPAYIIGNYILFSEYFPIYCNITWESRHQFLTGWTALVISMLIVPSVMVVFALAEQLYHRLKLHPYYLLAITSLNMPLLFILLGIATAEFRWAGCLSGGEKNYVVLGLLIGDWVMSTFCCVAALSVSLAHCKAKCALFSSDYQPIILNT